MGRRYYCDYCDKVFIDDIEARKKHLNSVHHIKLRKLHYDMFRDPRTILKEESSKVPCRRFLGNGFCQFESTCKYTHYTKDQLWEIKQQIQFEDKEKMKNMDKPIDVPSVDAWVAKYNQQKNLENNDCVTTFWTYPEHLENRPDLPPSLKKFQPEFFTDDNFEDWG